MAVKLLIAYRVLLDDGTKEKIPAGSIVASLSQTEEDWLISISAAVRVNGGEEEMVEVKRGKVEVGEKAFQAGNVIDGLSKEDEDRLVQKGVADYIEENADDETENTDVNLNLNIDGLIADPDQEKAEAPARGRRRSNTGK